MHQAIHGLEPLVPQYPSCTFPLPPNGNLQSSRIACPLSCPLIQAAGPRPEAVTDQLTSCLQEACRGELGPLACVVNLWLARLVLTNGQFVSEQKR